MRPMYYKRDGTPYEGTPDDPRGSLLWAKDWGDRPHKIISQTTLPNGNFVSTVWLGLDHSFGEDGPPLIFETMVFPKKGIWVDVDMERYSTEEEAVQGHQRMVKKWSKNRNWIYRIFAFLNKWL